MPTHLYLSMVPESLVASMLGPGEFGAYLATGTRKRPHGETMFFELREGFTSDCFRLADVQERCVPHADGVPKHSVYLAVYRVLEHVPVAALGSLWLTTAHGRSLELKPTADLPDSTEPYHLYQEICPVHPLIASSLGPRAFCQLITDPSRSIFVPRLCFVELELASLADDPVSGSAADLPYHNLDHLRDCLAELAHSEAKHTKTVDRISRLGLLYRCVKRGFFVGDQEQMLYYPYPARSELESQHYKWWRCANDSETQRVGLLA